MKRTDTFNCRLSYTDRPCQPHKATGVKCEECDRYSPYDTRILIVKLAADGDVLRTTCLLPKIKELYPRSFITWLTEKSAKPLLENNPYIDRIYAPPVAYWPELMVETYDLVINTDADYHSCAIAAAAKAQNHHGFTLNEDRSINAWSDDAYHWLEMGRWDDLKKANRRSYPEIIYSICGFDLPAHAPQLFITESEKQDAMDHLKHCGWKPDSGRTVIGINTGAGERWQKKSLPLLLLKEVVKTLDSEKYNFDIFLLGGPSETDRNNFLKEGASSNVINTKTDNSLRRFISIVDNVHVLLTADTMAMHIGIALEKYVVAHFGPTSPWEIDFFGHGEGLVPDIECLCCYKPDCKVSPACNELISANQIIDAILRGYREK